MNTSVNSKSPSAIIEMKMQPVVVKFIDVTFLNLSCQGNLISTFCVVVYLIISQ